MAASDPGNRVQGRRPAPALPSDEPGHGSGRDTELLIAVFNHVGQGLLVIDRTMRVTELNERFSAIFGFEPGTIRVGMTMRELVAAAHARGHYGEATVQEAFQGWIDRLAAATSGQRIIKLTNGLTVSASYIPFANGWVLTYEDVSERLRNKAALEAKNQLFDAALKHAPHGFCMFDAKNRMILCNPAYMRLYDLPFDLCEPGTPLDIILEYRSAHGNAPRDLSSYFETIEVARSTNILISEDVPLHDGRMIRITNNPMANGGYVATHEDVTAAIRAETQVRYLASHDALTGLPNRTALHERLRNALTGLGPDEHLAVLCLDLDAFKVVNETFGHTVGDRLLQIATERFRAAMRPTDMLARLGGDEFVAIQVGLLGPEEAGALAERLVGRISAPFDIDGQTVTASVSIGIAFCPNDGIEVGTVLKNAGLALYSAKMDGRNTYRFFEAAMDAPVQARRRLERDLRAALTNDAFHLNYQPEVDVETGAITGFEALLRWQHPERGLVPPAEFIAVAEETGLIVKIGEWVLRRACTDAVKWPAHVTVAVNLSPIQFKTGNLPLVVLAALAESGLPPARLELEITESVRLIDNEPTLATLHQFRALGIRIALDDFGTGYSSLSYLRCFPFDKIKIDKSFIHDLVERPDCAAIVKAVADLGRALGMTTTAEGIETAEQLDIVRQQGCREAQGFLFSEPRPADEVQRLLGQDPGSPAKAA